MLEANRFYIYLSDRKEPIPWNLHADPQPADAPRYWQRVLQRVDSDLPQRGLAVYLTWRLEQLPEYGEKVVAVVMGDEWARYPAYLDRIGLAFKCYGARPPVEGWSRHRTLYMQALLAAKQARTWMHWLPGALRHGVRSVRQRGRMAPLFAVPLGYGNQDERPVRPMRERTTDLFFAGSIEHGKGTWWPPSGWVRNPKAIARAEMIDAVRALEAQYPDLTADIVTMRGFALNALHYGSEEAAQALDTAAYSERMMAARFCLVPRGTSLETFRFFEAIRYGCIPVTEQLPSRTFYDGAPGLQLRAWGELPERIRPLLSDETQLEELQERVLEWWQSHCSEEAVARFITDRIRSAVGRDHTHVNA